MVCYNVVYLLHCHAITTFIPYNLVRKSVNMCEKLYWAGEVSTRRVVFVGPRQLNKTYWVNILRSTPGISQTFYPALSVEMFELQCRLVTGPRQICAEEILSTQPNNAQLATMSRGRYQARSHLKQSFWHLTHHHTPPSNFVKGTRVIAQAYVWFWDPFEILLGWPLFA